ncbi:MAG: hypothetical protein Q7T80_15340 [Methanoregula sp.]|nr:hypothetical protein [Methanoregula sp.]
MCSDSDTLTSELPERDFFSETWALLPWTPWVLFTADKSEFRQIPKEPGLYRIRPAGKDFLMYIGETRRPLHQRLLDLRMELRGTAQMPWADPHAESAALWAWQDAEAFEYECSAAPLDATANGRRGMENYLLYRYRQEYLASTPCNFGRFHPRYRKSTPRKENLRGGKLAEGQKSNPAGSPGSPPLTPAGIPGEPGWMGLAWSARVPFAPETAPEDPAGPCLFILTDAISQEILYLGQSAHCINPLPDHVRKSSEGRELLVSYHTVEKTVLPHQLREMECDLVGNYFGQYKKAPEFQFRNRQ